VPPAVTLEASVLVDIAAGLAEAVQPAQHAQGATILLETSAYEATLDRIEPGACLDIGAGRHTGAAFAVVGGVLLIWAGHSVAHVLTRGGSCALSADEAVRVVNSGDEPATVVTAWANPAVPAMTTTRSSPCPSSLRR
jgi:hypothetical protein